VPARRGEPGLTPILVDVRVAGLAADRDSDQSGPDRGRQERRAQAGHQDPALPVHQDRHCAGKHRRGVTQQAAPVARMVGALPQAHPQREPGRAARAQEDRRPPSCYPRPVRGDQQVADVPGAKFAKSRGAGFLARTFRLKPSLPLRAASTCSSAARLMVCWPLLSAVPLPYQRSPSTVTRHGSSPARQAARLG
jgi:hypothetical protein